MNNTDNKRNHKYNNDVFSFTKDQELSSTKSVRVAVKVEERQKSNFMVKNGVNKVQRKE